MKTENLYRLALVGLFAVISIALPLTCSKMDSQNDLLNKVYVRQAAENQRLDDIEKRMDRKENIDSLKIEVQKLKAIKR